MIGKTRQVAAEPRGVLHRLAQGEFSHHRAAPPADLVDRIEHFWRVSWNLDGLPPQVQETLPHPNVHLVIEPGSAAAWGVHTERWTRVLEGRSTAFGIKLRPGAIRPLLGRPVASLSNRAVPLAMLFGEAAVELNEVLACYDEGDDGDGDGDGDGDAAAVERAATFLRARLPALDERAQLAGRIVDSAAADLSLHTAEALAARFGMSLRALQRLFSEYVGVSPKWVIQRYRLHEAVARVQAGQPVSWAALAQDLGYFDHAHFIADFRKLVGRTPADYAQRLGPA